MREVLKFVCGDEWLGEDRRRSTVTWASSIPFAPTWRKSMEVLAPFCNSEQKMF